MSEIRKYKFGLALSGGGARGAAHVGVLQALEEAGLRPEVISGASAGSIVGALYSSGMTPKEIMDFVKDSSLLKAYRLSFPTNGLTHFNYLQKELAKMIKEDSFEALKIPLHVATTNLETGQLKMFNSGKLFKIVQASGTIPLVFKPVEINGQMYVDGGATNNLPVQPIRDLCEVVLGVNLVPVIPVERKEFRGFFGLTLRCVYLAISANSQPGAAMCDFIIEPDELYKYDVFRFKKAEEMYEIGYQYAKAILPQLSEKIASLN